VATVPCGHTVGAATGKFGKHIASVTGSQFATIKPSLTCSSTRCTCIKHRHLNGSYFGATQVDSKFIQRNRAVIYSGCVTIPPAFRWAPDRLRQWSCHNCPGRV